MRVVVDAMGSDNAPGPEIEGALEASRTDDVEVVLVGDQAKLESALVGRPHGGKISIAHASEVIAMDESPIMAVRKKKDSSLVVALRLIKSGEGDALVSAGSTGAVHVAARTILGPTKGVARSALCQMLPTLREPVLLLDFGANVACTVRHLCEFAELGTIYSERALGVKEPRVGLLNIGEEEEKGNELTRAVHRRLSAARHLNFIGNVEPAALFEGAADVVVCDGFVGNVVLKTSEAVASLLVSLLKREMKSSYTSMFGALLCSGAFSRLKKVIDSNEQHGATLLGVNGTAIIHHGSCSGRGMANAIRGARRAAEAEVKEHIRDGIEELRAVEATLNHQESGEST